MERNEILSELNEIFKDNFDDDSIELTEETTGNDIEDWDSLEHINIIMACERKWKIKFDLDEVAEMKKIGDIISNIIKKLS